jgi:proteasome lid subunit RPN8/RPN11
VSLDGASEAASFDEDKMNHLSRLSPEERAEIAFIMDAQEMFQAVKDMRNHGLTLQVVYHSHPHDPARPSVTDIKIANEWEENWSRLNLSLPIYMLISLMDKSRPDVQAYWIRNASVSSADVVTL